MACVNCRDAETAQAADACETVAPQRFIQAIVLVPVDGDPMDLSPRQQAHHVSKYIPASLRILGTTVAV